MATVGEVFRSSVGSPELHVLAVDDSFVDRKVIERLLKISCCEVTAVDSGTRALQYLGLDGEKSSVGFDALKVNMIITDYSMPGMTGYELLKKIKESSAFREIPVVIMSSENILTRIDRCLEEGAEEYLVKPVKLADVKRLKDFIIKGDGKETGKLRVSMKRKLPRQDIDIDSSSSSSPPMSPQSPSTPLSFSPSISTLCDSASSQLESSPSSSPETQFMKRPKLHHPRD